MVQAAKEKALQLERKRKAASFLAQLAERKTTVSSATLVQGGGDSSAEEGELKEATSIQSVSPPPGVTCLITPVVLISYLTSTIRPSNFEPLPLTEALLQTYSGELHPLQHLAATRPAPARGADQAG